MHLPYNHAKTKHLPDSFNVGRSNISIRRDSFDTSSLLDDASLNPSTHLSTAHDKHACQHKADAEREIEVLKREKKGLNLSSALSIFANVLDSNTISWSLCDDPHRHLRISSQKPPSGLHNGETHGCSQPRLTRLPIDRFYEQESEPLLKANITTVNLLLSAALEEVVCLRQLSFQPRGPNH